MFYVHKQATIFSTPRLRSDKIEAMVKTKNPKNGSLEKEEFSERLKKLRKQRGISQIELAKAIGLHRNIILRYENGVVKPTADSLKKITDYFNISSDYLLEGVKENGLKVDFDDKDLIELFKEVSHFSKEEKDTIKDFLEAFVFRKKLKHMVK